MFDDLKGDVSVITGGNRGIGLGCAKSLAQVGSDIAIIARNEKKCLEAIEQLKQYDVKCKYYIADVTSQKEIQQSVDKIIDDFGRIDVLVNNSGIVRNVGAEDMSWNDWYDVINVNLNGVFIVSQIVGRHMIKQKKGSIVNISSISAYIVNEPQLQCSYNASKAAVSQLTKSLAFEWVKHNIRVNAIAPGYILTDLLKHGQESNMFDHWMEMTPMKRAGNPEDIGKLSVYLASDASSFTTGSIFIVDGGYTLT